MANESLLDRELHAQLLRMSVGYIIAPQASSIFGIPACCSSPVWR